MIKVWYKYIQLLILLSLSLVSNAQNEKRKSEDSVSKVVANDSVKKLGGDSSVDYSVAYESALKRNEELLKLKQCLSDSIGIWHKELKKYNDSHASIVKSIEKLEAKVRQEELKVQKSGVIELRRKRDALLEEIRKKEEEKQRQDSCLREISSKLNDKKSQIQNLASIKDNVSKQVIAENKDYLEKPFHEMDLVTLTLIKSKCQKYSSDANVNAFVSQIDHVIKNKQLFNDITKIVNSPYSKFEVDKALVAIPHFTNINSAQRSEILELKRQLTIFPSGLATFKEFINNLNRCRNGVSYSIDFYRADKKSIFPNDLEQKVKDVLLAVPYLKTKYEKFMEIFKKNPNKHSDIEAEILNQ